MKKIFTLIVTLIITATAVAADSAQGVVTPGQGTKKSYALSCYARTFYGILYKKGYLASIIWSDDGKDVWLGDFFPESFDDGEAYIHGTVDGNKITIRKQLICKDHYSILDEDTADVSIIPLVADSSGNYEEADSFTMTIGDNGDITLDRLDNGNLVIPFLAELDGDGHIVTVVVNDTTKEENAYDIAYNMKYAMISDQEIQKVEIPAGVTMNDYVLVYDREDDGFFKTRNTKIGFDGNDVYLQNFSLTVDSAVIKGHLSEHGDTITIPDDQYLGIYYSNLMTFFCSANLGDDSFHPTAGRQAMFVKDENDVWHLTDSLYMLDVSYDGRVFDYYTNASFSVLKADVEDTPQDPFIVRILDGSEIMGETFVYMYFQYSVYGVNGNLMNVDNLYYRLYIDGEPLDLAANGYSEASQYPDGLIPVNVRTENSWIEDEGMEVNLSLCPWQTVGVQMVYVINGQQYVSNIVHVDHSGNVVTGVNRVNDSGNDAQDSPMYNLAGQRINGSYHGIVIRDGKKYMRK